MQLLLMSKHIVQGYTIEKYRRNTEKPHVEDRIEEVH